WCRARSPRQSIPSLVLGAPVRSHALIRNDCKFSRSWFCPSHDLIRNVAQLFGIMLLPFRMILSEKSHNFSGSCFGKLEPHPTVAFRVVGPVLAHLDEQEQVDGSVDHGA